MAASTRSGSDATEHMFPHWAVLKAAPGQQVGIHICGRVTGFPTTNSTIRSACVSRGAAIIVFRASSRYVISEHLCGLRGFTASARQAIIASGTDVPK
jgi:hypothetical protein